MSPGAEDEAPAGPPALLLTDLVDSAALSARLGDAVMAGVWAAHDRVARDLLQAWRGREIDKTDGFLLVFDRAGDALGFALAYHRALAGIALPQAEGEGAALRLRARAGLHVGRFTLRANPPGDVARGAKPFEVDGVNKPIAARVMSTALGGQTLVTAAALKALGPVPQRVMSVGHWRVMGLPAPLELFEIGEEGAPFAPPPDAPKVYRVVRHGDLWLPARDVRHSLPPQRDAFVGRREALRKIGRLFDEGARLVSLVGVGGCGKTRLATRLGWRVLGEFPGGVWFCDLATARDLDGVLHAVAQGLGLGAALDKDDPVAQLGHAIASRGHGLLILDNFEQVVRQAEASLGRWLERAAEARFLVTTREVLGIVGEVAMALPPLPAADAERLFIQRAAAAHPDPAGTPEDLAAVGPLVRLLDGLPLAIELAAARVRALPPRALLARMNERFKLLASSGRRLDRQATLRATFDWSWDLLSPPEKAALAQLSVFEGGFTLEAAEAVVDAVDLAEAGDASWSVDLVNSLVDKSFVRLLEGERFDLLMSVQDYAAEHLQTERRYPGSGASALRAAVLRHAAWFARLGPDKAVAQGCIERDNLVAACRRATGDGQADLALACLQGAWAALSLQGPFQTGIDLAEAVCAMPGLPAAVAAQAQAVLGNALQAAGRRDQAQRQYEQALARLATPTGPAWVIDLLVKLGSLLGPAEPQRRALQMLEQALSLARQQGEAALECAALNGLGTLEFEQGRMDAAQRHYEAALTLAQRIGHRRWQCSLLGNLGNLHASLGRMEAASTLSEEALAIARAIGDRRREGTTLSNLGMLLWLQGRLDAAAEACEAALVVAGALGHLRLECTVLCNLGLVREAEGKATLAQQHLEAALAGARRIGDRRAEGQVLGYLGLVQARQGALAAARAAFDEGQALLVGVSDALSLGVLLSHRAECEWRAGDVAAAALALADASRLAEEAGAGDASELGLALARLKPLLQAAPS
jgi:predicted ATPase/class 3 adenylate cyclase/Tfp pilus assembly protein PilF